MGFFLNDEIGGYICLNLGQYFIDEKFELLYKATSKDFQKLLGLNEFQNICDSIVFKEFK